MLLLFPGCILVYGTSKDSVQSRVEAHGGAWYIVGLRCLHKVFIYHVTVGDRNPYSSKVRSPYEISINKINLFHPVSLAASFLIIEMESRL